MILVYDLLSQGLSHLPFNIGYLAVLRYAHPETPIVFRGESNHLDALHKEGAARLGVELLEHSLDRSGAEAHRRPIRHLLRPDAAILTALHDARQIGARLVAILGGTPATLRTARFRWDQRAPRLDIVFHGLNGWMTGWRSRNPVRRYFDFRSEIPRYLPPNVRLVVLERAIRKQLVTLNPLRAQDMLVLEHPLPPYERPLVRERPERYHTRQARTFNIGFLGWATEGKGFRLFLDLAKRFAGTHLSFHAIGPRDSSLSDLHCACLTTPPAPEALTRAQFLHRLAGIDIACLPLVRPDYDWVCSGTVMDCINHGIPLLASRTTVLDDLWCRYGPLGYLCDDEDRFRFVLENKLKADFHEKEGVFRGNLLKAREDRLPARLARFYPDPEF